MEKIFFTVFTPIYNRKHTIHRVWESLMAQTNKNFEWIIVNDGSEDGVDTLLENYKEEADFDVRIFNQKNSGKHIAFNKAIDEAKGYFLIPADSDDSFSPITIEFFEKNWMKFGSDSISGIDVLCMDVDNQIIGDKYLERVSNFINVQYKNKIRGEKWGCIRVDILKKYKFPEMLGASFFSESYIWSQIGMVYNTIYLNTPLRVYHQDAGNQVMKVKNNSEGTIKIDNFYSLWWVNNMFPKVSMYLTYKEILKLFASIWRTTFLLKKSSLLTIKEIKLKKNKIWAIAIFIPSFIMYKIINKNS